MVTPNQQKDLHIADLGSEVVPSFDTYTSIISSVVFNERVFKQAFSEFIATSVEISNVFLKTEEHARSVAQKVNEASLALLDMQYDYKMIATECIKCMKDSNGGVHIMDFGKFLIDSKKGISFSITSTNNEITKHRIPVSQLYRQASAIEESNKKICNASSGEEKVKFQKRPSATIRVRFLLSLMKATYEGMKIDKDIDYNIHREKILEWMSKANEMLNTTPAAGASMTNGIAGFITGVMGDIMPGVGTLMANFGATSQAEKLSGKINEINFTDVRSKGTDYFKKLVYFGTPKNAEIVKRYFHELKKDEQFNKVVESVLKDSIESIVSRFTQEDVIKTLKIAEETLRRGATETGQTIDFEYTVEDLVEGLKTVDPGVVSSTFMNISSQ